jgi:hypothetical protein
VNDSQSSPAGMATMAAAGVLVVALHTSVCALQDTWLPPHFDTLAGPDRVDGYATMEAAPIYNTTVSHFAICIVDPWCCMATMRGGFVLSRARVMLTRSMLNMNSAFFLFAWPIEAMPSACEWCMGGVIRVAQRPFLARRGGWRGSTPHPCLPHLHRAAYPPDPNLAI